MKKVEIIPLDCKISKIEDKKLIDIENAKIGTDMKSFLHFFEESVFDFTPDRAVPVLHTIIWSQPASENVLKAIQKISKIANNYIESIYLVGVDWLEQDEHKISKSDGIVQFIIKQKNVYKILGAKPSQKEITQNLDIAKNSWVWMR